MVGYCTHESLMQASQFVQAVQNLQGLKIACLEEIALINGWLSKSELRKQVQSPAQNEYMAYLRELSK